MVSRFICNQSVTRSILVCRCDAMYRIPVLGLQALHYRLDRAVLHPHLLQTSWPRNPSLAVTSNLVAPPLQKRPNLSNVCRERCWHLVNTTESHLTSQLISCGKSIMDRPNRESTKETGSMPKPDHFFHGPCREKIWKKSCPPQKLVSNHTLSYFSKICCSIYCSIVVELGSISPNRILPNLFLIGGPTTTTCFVVFCFFDKLCFVVHHFFCTIFFGQPSVYVGCHLISPNLISRRILTITLTLTLTLVRFRSGLYSRPNWGSD